VIFKTASITDLLVSTPNPHKNCHCSSSPRTPSTWFLHCNPKPSTEDVSWSPFDSDAGWSPIGPDADSWSLIELYACFGVHLIWIPWDYSLGSKMSELPNPNIRQNWKQKWHSRAEEDMIFKTASITGRFSKWSKPAKKCHSELLPQGHHQFDFCKPKPSTKRILVRVQLTWMLVWAWLIWMLVRVQLIRMLVGVQLIWMPVGVWLIQMLVGVWSILMLVLESDWFG
jgi:hypothetical protein